MPRNNRGIRMSDRELSRSGLILADLNKYLADTGYAVHLNPTFLEFYVSHLLMTSTGHLPEVRLMRHSGLMTLFYCVLEAAVPGEVAECGCYAGLSSLQMATTMRRFNYAFNGLGLHLFDSFEGLSEPVAEDFNNATHDIKFQLETNDFKIGDDHVRKVFTEQGYPNVQIYKGWIPSRFNEVADRVFKFVHLDVDLYEPTKEGLEFFWPRMYKGGVIITDDYDWPGPRKAIDDFAAANGIELHKTQFDQAWLAKT